MLFRLIYFMFILNIESTSYNRILQPLQIYAIESCQIYNIEF